MTEAEWLTMSMTERMAEAAGQLVLTRIDAQMLGLPEPAAIPPAIPKVTDRKIRLFCHAVLQVCGRGPFDDDYYPTPSVEIWGRSCAAEVREPSLLSRYPNLDRASLLREIFGNPFQYWPCGGNKPMPAWPEDFPWLTPDVLSLTQVAYENRVEQLGDHQQYERFVTNIGTTNSRCLVCGYVATSNKIERNHRQFCSGWGTLDPELFIILSDALEEAGCTDRVVIDHLRSPGLHVRGCWVLDLLLGKE